MTPLPGPCGQPCPRRADGCPHVGKLMKPGVRPEEDFRLFHNSVPSWLLLGPHDPPLIWQPVPGTLRAFHILTGDKSRVCSPHPHPRHNQCVRHFPNRVVYVMRICLTRRGRKRDSGSARQDLGAQLCCGLFGQEPSLPNLRLSSDDHRPFRQKGSSSTQPATQDTRPERFNTHASRQRWLELQIFPSFQEQKSQPNRKRFRRGAQGETDCTWEAPVRQTWRFISLTRREDLEILWSYPGGWCAALRMFRWPHPQHACALSKNKRGSDSIPERLQSTPQHPSPVRSPFRSLL